jgi:hypothetical protein
MQVLGHRVPPLSQASSSDSWGRLTTLYLPQHPIMFAGEQANDDVPATWRLLQFSFPCSIKPNKIKSDSLFDHSMILAQLLYAGVLETVRIRRQGFPFRETYAEFWRRACRVGYVFCSAVC